ncbi:DUF1642 domain-containing protein [Loigolactobacillus backii]|uniref:DUF1642 domain-containing protein n=1 Tax=Loigolactobacillus backii TaxID=375175 RepID=UPI0007F0B09A|nr:DUF1642 domain-containing protein [Loigolactobacillus backii]ANK59832.1 hypothetical protein AYR52_05895 [Loigolactobacillus backii]
MSNETKRDVFERALDEWYDLIFKVGGQGEEAYGYCEFDGTLSKYEKDYAAALPDDMPVIPKAVGEYIEDAKASHYELLDAMTKLTLDQPVFDWIHDNSDTFARAWLDGYEIDNKS